jgi:hypothetical protein
MYFILIQKCGIVNITRKTNALDEKKAGFIKGGRVKQLQILTNVIECV